MITKLHQENLRKRKQRTKSVPTVVDNNTVVDNKKLSFNNKEKMRIVMNGQSNAMPIEELCQLEGISIDTFQKWTKDFLNNDLLEADEEFDNHLSGAEQRFKIVIEGKTGQTSVAEICRREGIDHDVFLRWCEEFVLVRNRNSILRKFNNPNYKQNKDYFDSNSTSDVFNYVENYIDLSSSKTIVGNGDLASISGKDLMSFVNLAKINDVRYINKHLEQINEMLPVGGLYVGCLETFSARKKRMKISKVPIFKDLYFGLEFLTKRILPKVSFTKKYYFDFTKGNDRLLSKAEGLGRLVSCGFRIMDFKSIDGLIYYVVKKEKDPAFDDSPSYGPLYKMPRLGKNGKIIGVYKLRTMHPYSEYLQDYIVNAHGYANSGKPANDFRIPSWGKFMRKFWLDEIPQLMNVLKGELKLVGIRPVSKRYFEDIPTEMQKLRLTQKPGCIPPYVALNREGNVLSVLQAEKEYLDEKIRNPYTTDMKFFFTAIYNIVFKNKRSA